MKKYISLFLSVFLLASCQMGPPSLFVKADGKSMAVYEGSYCWESFGKGECVSTGGPADLIEEDKPPAVSAQSEVTLSFSEKPDELHVTCEGSMERIKITGENGKASFALPDEPGVHVYTAAGRWEQGSAVYMFQVQVD